MVAPRSQGGRRSPGCAVTERSALVGWDERETSLGLTLFSRYEYRWTNQRGEPVKRRTKTFIRY